jgi:hypothetical protein
MPIPNDEKSIFGLITLVGFGSGPGAEKCAPGPAENPGHLALLRAT